MGMFDAYLKVFALNSRFFYALLKVPLCLGLATLVSVYIQASSSVQFRHLHHPVGTSNTKHNVSKDFTKLAKNACYLL